MTSPQIGPHAILACSAIRDTDKIVLVNGTARMTYRELEELPVALAKQCVVRYSAYHATARITLIGYRRGRSAQPGRSRGDAALLVGANQIAVARRAVKSDLEVMRCGLDSAHQAASVRCLATLLDEGTGACLEPCNADLAQLCSIANASGMAPHPKGPAPSRSVRGTCHNV